jgi:NAD-dependent dihydropyrimidine dehydrogenase PreA subunit
MDKDVDLSIRLAGLTFKSPIVVSSSECAANLSLIVNLVDKNIGAIVTKTYTSPPDFRIRVRPYQFPLNRFGKAYSTGGCLFSLAAPHPEDNQAVKKHVSQMADLCKQSDACVLCGECETTCIYNVFKVDKSKNQVSIDEDKCWSCGFCVGICPTGTIELRNRRDKKRVIWNNQGLAVPFIAHHD